MGLFCFLGYPQFSIVLHFITMYSIGMAKKSITINLSEEILSKAKKVAEEKRWSVSILIEEALTAIFKTK